jgi:tryptophan-rich sensory protein
MKRYLQPIILIFILQVLAFLTSYFVTENAVSTWYQDINKAALNPPDWLFAPVWTILYALLAIALWILWRARHDPNGKIAFGLFVAQLVLNYCWSPVFFGLQAFTAAFIILLAMIGLSIGAMVMTRRRIVVWLMIPYMAWISFATYLTFEVMRLN